MPKSQETNLTCASRVQTALGQSLHNSLFHSHMKKIRDKIVYHHLICRHPKIGVSNTATSAPAPEHFSCLSPWDSSSALSQRDCTRKHGVLYILPNTNSTGDTQWQSVQKAMVRQTCCPQEEHRLTFHTPMQSSPLWTSTSEWAVLAQRENSENILI